MAPFMLAPQGQGQVTDQLLVLDPGISRVAICPSSCTLERRWTAAQPQWESTAAQSQPCHHHRFNMLLFPSMPPPP